MAAFDFETVQGDTPTWSDTLTYSTGAAVNLTGATLTFIVRSLTAAAPVTLAGTASIVSAAAGTVQFAASAADTATPGQYMAQWKVTFAGGSVMTFPTVGYLSVHVEENLTTAGGEQLVSVPDVKDYLGLRATDRVLDAKLARLIRAARPVVENITGPIISAVYDEWHDGGGSIIQLRRRPSTSYATAPILNLSGVVGATTLGIDEYRGSTKHPLTVVTSPTGGTTYSCMVDRLGTVTRRTAGGGTGCFPPGQSVHVVYQAGQSSVPPNVYEGVLELLRVNYERTMAVGRGGSVVPPPEESGGPPLGFYVPRKVREILAPSRRAPAVA